VGDEASMRAVLAVEPLLARRGPYNTLQRILDEAVASNAAPQLRARAHEARGRSLRIRARIEAAIEDQRAALALASAHGQDALVLACRVHLAALFRESGRIDEARAAIDGAMADGDAHGGRLLGMAWVEAANIARVDGRPDEALAGYQRAIDLLRMAGDTRNTASALNNLAGLHFESARQQAALATWQETTRLLERVGDHRLEVVTRANVAALLVEREELDEAKVHFTRALSLARAIGDVRTEAWLLLARGGAAQEEGDLLAALSDQTRCLAAASLVGARLVGLALASLGGVLHELGRLDEARLRYEAAIAKLSEAGDTRLEGIVRGRMCALYAATAKLALASRAADDAEHLLIAHGQALDVASVAVHRGWLAPADDAEALRSALEVAAEHRAQSSEVRLAERLLRARVDRPGA
jgi:tetratricopeptide (TPR) repeat protein